jgi:hypothetical protein
MNTADNLAHAIHRDLKSSNMMINRRGEREVHQVEGELDTTYRVNILVDGVLAEGNLFPHMRATIFAFVFSFLLVATVTSTLGAILLTRLLASRTTSRRVPTR